MHKVLLIILVMFSLASAVQSETLYKWVDEQGQVHYTDEPPNGPCEEIKAPECPSEKDIQMMQERLERQKQLLREYDEKRDQEHLKAKRAKQKREVNAMLCEEAKKKLRFIEEAKGMRMAREGPGGELRWISDAERDKMEIYWRKQVERFCD